VSFADADRSAVADRNEWEEAAHQPSSSHGISSPESPLDDSLAFLDQQAYGSPHLAAAMSALEGMQGGGDVARSLVHGAYQGSPFTSTPGQSMSSPHQAPSLSSSGLGAATDHTSHTSKAERGAALLRSSAPEVPATPAGLVAAAGESDLARMQRMLGSHIGVDSRDHAGSTALMVSSWHGNAEAVGKLLSAGAALELKGADGETALHLAAWGGNVRCLELLIRGGAGLGSKDNDDMTPLMHAAWNGRLEAVETLLRAGAKVDAMDTNGATSLMLAAEEGHADVLRILQKAAAGATVIPARDT